MGFCHERLNHENHESPECIGTSLIRDQIGLIREPCQLDQFLGELGLINRGRFLHRKQNIRVMPRGKSIDRISLILEGSSWD